MIECNDTPPHPLPTVCSLTCVAEPKALAIMTIYNQWTLRVVAVAHGCGWALTVCSPGVLVIDGVGTVGVVNEMR